MIDLSGIATGTDVYSSDGHKIGTVEGTGTTMMGGSGLDTGGVTDVDAGTTPNTYIKVHRHHLIGHDVDLYIPSTQVLEIGDNRVTVGCARDVCEEQYAIRPTGLQELE
jgi:hypothetical protein